MSSSCSHDLDRRVNVILNEINKVKPELFQSELPECHSTRNSSRSTSGSTSVSTSPTIELLDNAKHASESSSLSNSQQHIVTEKVSITIHIHRWQKLLLAMKKSKQSQASIDVSARWSVFEDTDKSRRKILNIYSGNSIYFPSICEERGSYHSCYKKSSRRRKEPSAAAKGRVLTPDAAAPDRLKIRSDGRDRELAAWIEMRRKSGGELQGQLERSLTSMRSYITYASTSCETSDSIHPDSGALSYRPSAK